MAFLGVLDHPAVRNAFAHELGVLLCSHRRRSHQFLQLRGAGVIVLNDTVHSSLPSVINSKSKPSASIRQAVPNHEMPLLRCKRPVQYYAFQSGQTCICATNQPPDTSTAESGTQFLLWISLICIRLFTDLEKMGLYRDLACFPLCQIAGKG